MLLGSTKLAPVIRPAKVVPASMADEESAEPLLEGSAMSREHPASGQEQQERQGRAVAERRGSGMGERGEQPTCRCFTSAALRSRPELAITSVILAVAPAAPVSYLSCPTAAWPASHRGGAAVK
jgi:hypothetical protein